jgi:hypothetical protein
MRTPWISHGELQVYRKRLMKRWITIVSLPAQLKVNKIVIKAHNLTHIKSRDISLNNDGSFHHQREYVMMLMISAKNVAIRLGTAAHYNYPKLVKH